MNKDKLSEIGVALEKAVKKDCERNITVSFSGGIDSALVAFLASIGVILGAAYILWLYKRVVFGELFNSDLKKMVDLNRSELIILTCLAFPILFFGFYPEPLINTIEVSITNLIETYNLNLKINN